ncbi:MAG: response regulator [Campylobacterota bacterium]|nr:response regulator [Campylobacterota bacterium]
MSTLKAMVKYAKHLKVLYVEDDLDLVQTNKDLFENYFFSLDIAHNGQEGLTQYQYFYESNNEYYDLVISDINMPLMNGIEMITEILKVHDMQSTVIISAHNESQYLSSAIDLGVNGFLTKPMKTNKLVDVLYKVSQAISDHKFVNEHIHTIEDLNMKLEEQNRELIAKNSELEKSFRMLDTMVNKEQISHPPKKEIPFNKISDEDAKIQEQIEYLVNDDLPELMEIHENLDVTVIEIINSIEQIDIYSLPNLIKGFQKYASILSFYSFFDELSGVMKGFAITLQENQLPKNTETIEGIFMLLESFMYVLGKWQNDLALGDKKKINSLDASMISDMNTITNMWTQKEEEATEEDLDDIFDF